MHIIKLELRSRFFSILIRSVVISVIIFALMFFYQFYRMDLVAIANKILELPQEFVNAIALGGPFSFHKHMNFYAFIRMLISIFLSYFALLAGCRMLTREQEDGSMPFFFGQPVGRLAIVLWKFAANILLLIVSEAVLYASSIAALFPYITFDVKRADILINLLKITGGSLFIEILFLAIGTLYSVRATFKSIPENFSFNLIFISLLLGEIPQILRICRLLFSMAAKQSFDILETAAQKLSFFKYLSPVSWVLPEQMMAQGIGKGYLIVGIIVTVACIFCSILLYYRKDL